ncbi:MAG: glycosyltransferase family 4 protein [Lachnospiraceae bacterium]|jgi:glycosyltransferase involved in cell wall biosynthesis|nr:glycosyltransferase family 4 protein [Lachnospiraceae bacterium]
MNVILLNDSFPPVIDGVANVVMNYARIMTEQDMARVIVGTPRYPDAEYDKYPYKVIPYHSINTTGIVNGYRAGNPFSMTSIGEMISDTPDIIHTHCPVSSTVMARILRNETQAPVIFTYHTKFDVDIARAMKAKFLQKESIKTLIDNISACDDVWVVSKGAGENMRSLGYEGDYIVMPNGVDFAKGRVEEAAMKEAVKDYDLPEGVPVFLFVGRMMKYKGLPLILDAMKILSENGMDFRMIFVGDGMDAPEMKQKAVDEGIADKVIFTGAEHDRNVLRAWNTRADLFLFPSTYDTNGIVVREAAACGLASVLIKDSCAAEGITDNRNGYIIEETPQAMAACLMEACKDMEHVHQVGQNAMDEIYISWDSAVKLAYERYGEILELKQSGKLGSRKKESSDYFISIATNIAEITSKTVHMPKKIYYGMMENFEEMLEEMQEKQENFKADMHEMKDNLKEGMHEVKDGIKDSMHGIRDDFKDGMHGMKDTFKEGMHEMKENFKEGMHEIRDTFSSGPQE